MLTTTQKIGMAAGLIISSLILALLSFAAGWENMPDNQKEWLVTAGYGVTALLFLGSAVYSVIFTVSAYKESISLVEDEEYNKRMANQFNVGCCISPRHWLDADDYRRFAAGSRK